MSQGETTADGALSSSDGGHSLQAFPAPRVGAEVWDQVLMAVSGLEADEGGWLTVRDLAGGAHGEQHGGELLVVAP